MKKLVFIFLITITENLMACDICGCANSGSFFGVLPQSHLRIIGIKSRIRSFDSHVNSLTQSTRENYHSNELWARLYPLPKVQILANLPYHFNSQELKISKEKKELKGLGDASFTAYYNLKNTFWDSTHTSHFNHTILIGMGIKAPTGKYRYQSQITDVLNPNFQLGTGSFDGTLAAIHTVRWHDFGINTEGQLKLNGKNKNNYRFGNKVNGSITAFFSPKIGELLLVAQMGAFAEIAKNDKLQNVKNSDTGGWQVSAHTGFDIYYKQLQFGLNIQKPIAQNLAKNQIKANENFSANLAYLF